MVVEDDYLFNIYFVFLSLKILDLEAKIRHFFRQSFFLILELKISKFHKFEIAIS